MTFYWRPWESSQSEAEGKPTSATFPWMAEAEGMKEPPPPPERREPGIYALPSKTTGEKVGEFIARGVLPFYPQITGETPWLSPETAMEIPSRIAYGALGTAIAKPIAGKLGNWFRLLTNKERGLVTQSLDDMIAKGYSEGEALRTWDNPTWRSQALSRRMTGESPLPFMAGEGTVPSPKPTAISPIPQLPPRSATEPVPTPLPVGLRPPVTELPPTVKRAELFGLKEGIPELEPTRKALEPVKEMRKVESGVARMSPSEWSKNPELVSEAKLAAEKTGISPENLEYVGLQKFTPYSNDAMHLWNVTDPSSPQYLSTVAGPTFQLTEGQTKRLRPMGILKGERGSLGETKPAPMWYSTLQRTIEDKMPNSAPVEQVKALLSTPGVKADEIKWTGLDDFLASKTGKVSKQDVMNHLRENEVKVDEVLHKEGLPPESQAIVEDAYQRMTTGGQISHYEYGRIINEESMKYPKPKFSQWQLPGGENYRELVLTSPKVTAGPSHAYDTPGHFAWTRFNDRADSAGKKVLMLEEVQEHDIIKEWRKLNKLANEKKATETDVIRKKEIEQKVPFVRTWHELAMRRMVRWASDNGYDKVAWTTGEQQAARYDLSKQIKEVSVQKTDIGGYAIRYQDNSGRMHDVEGSIQPEKLPEYVGKDLANKIVQDVIKSYETKVYSGLDLKVGGEGMKGFYDKILPEYMNKFGKKWGAKVGEMVIDVGRKSGRYEGPEYTLEQIENMKFPTKIGKTQYVNLYLDDVANDMRHGKTFKEAIAPQISEDLAKVLGGKVVYDRTETVHSFDIPPSIKKSVLEEGLPLFQLLPPVAVGAGLLTERLTREKRKSQPSKQNVIRSQK